MDLSKNLKLIIDNNTFNIYNRCIMNNTQSLSISKLRQNATQVVNSVVAKQQPAIILKRSKPAAILVDIDYFESLENAVLDLADAKEADKAKNEKRDNFSSYIKKRWGKNEI